MGSKFFSAHLFWFSDTYNASLSRSHGASVADLDENSMFYLAARGIDRRVSRAHIAATSYFVTVFFLALILKTIFTTMLMLSFTLNFNMTLRRRASCCWQASCSICWRILSWWKLFYVLPIDSHTFSCLSLHEHDRSNRWMSRTECVSSCDFR